MTNLETLSTMTVQRAAEHMTYAINSGKCAKDNFSAWLKAEAARPVNRPYTLDELRALPQDTRVWYEENPDKSDWGSEWYARADLDYDEFTEEYGDTWRAWPAPPTADDLAAWPWEVRDGKDNP